MKFCITILLSSVDRCEIRIVVYFLKMININFQATIHSSTVPKSKLQSQTFALRGTQLNDCANVKIISAMALAFSGKFDLIKIETRKNDATESSTFGMKNRSQ